MTKLSLDQRRAQEALAQIKKVKEGNYERKFRSYVSSFPSKIILFGLGNAVATELSSAGRKQDKDDPDRSAHEHLIKSIFSWISNKNNLGMEFDHSRWKVKVLGYLSTIDQKEYTLVQSEVLSYLGWLKKFSQALLKKEEDIDE